MDSTDGQVEVVAALAHNDGPVGIATASTIVIGMGHQLPAQRALAADAIITLAAYGELPPPTSAGPWATWSAAGRSSSIGSPASSTRTWRPGRTALAQAVPLLLPGPGEKARAGLGELLKVAARAAVRAGARGDIPGLGELAARKGSSLLIHEAWRLSEAISA